MKIEQFEGVMENAYGKKLPEPIKFNGTYEAYEAILEVSEANDLLKDQEVIDFRNNQRKANARQKSMQTALDNAGVIKPTLENDTQLRLRKVYDVLIANGETHEEARAIAAATLKLVWEA